MRIVIRMIALILILAVASLGAYAHSCVTFERVDDEKYKSELAKIDAIFYGEVVEIGERTIDANVSRFDFQPLQIRILRSWRGPETTNVMVYYFRAYDDFQKEVGLRGTRKLFFARRGEDGTLRVDFCSFETLFGEVRMKTVLGEGKEIVDTSLPARGEPRSWLKDLWAWITSFFV